MSYDTKNKELRTKLRQDSHSVLSYVSKDIDIVVKTNSKKTIYIIVPDVDGNMDNLSQVNAAGTVGTLTTAGTATTLSTVSSSVATIASLGTVACTSTVGVDIK